MSKVTFFPAGAVVLTADDARTLAQVLWQINDELSRRGGRLKPEVLNLAVELSSISGRKEVVPQDVDEHVEYEQIDTNTAAEILGCTPRNVRDLADKGRIQGHKTGNAWIFARDDVEAYRGYK